MSVSKCCIFIYIYVCVCVCGCVVYVLMVTTWWARHLSAARGVVCEQSKVGIDIKQTSKNNVLFAIQAKQNTYIKKMWPPLVFSASTTRSFRPLLYYGNNIVSSCFPCLPTFLPSPPLLSFLIYPLLVQANPKTWPGQLAFICFYWIAIWYIFINTYAPTFPPLLFFIYIYFIPQYNHISLTQPADMDQIISILQLV